MTRVLDALAPVIPSLYAPVIMELKARIFRFSTKIFFSKIQVMTAVMGMTRIRIAARDGFSRNMNTTAPMI